MNIEKVSINEVTVENIKEKEKNAGNNKIIKIGELIAPITIFIVILSMVKQILYYTNFNLQIKYFIGFSEIGMFISDDLLNNIFLFATSFAIPILQDIFFPSIRKMDAAKEEKPIVEKKRGKGYKVMIVIFKILFLLGLYVFSIWYRKHYVLHFYDLIYYYVGWFLAFVILFLIFRLEVLRNFTGGQLILALVIGMLFFSIVTQAGSDIEEAEAGKYTGTTILLKDSTCYVSSKDSYFIGKTEKYYFQYNAKDSSTDIIPTDEVKIFHLVTNKFKKPAK